MYPKRSPAGEGAAGGSTAAEGDGKKQDEGTTAASGGTGGTGTAEGQTGARMFTQEELQAIVAREVRKAEDPETKRKAKAYDELQAQQQTDQEKAEKAAKEADERAQRAIDEANKRLIKAELKLQLAAQGARPDAVELAVDRLLGSDTIEVDDKGEVKGAEQAVKDLLKTHEYLKAPTDGQKLPDKSGGEFKGGEPATIDDQIAEAEAKGDYKTARSLKIRKYESGKTNT